MIRQFGLNSLWLFLTRILTQGLSIFFIGIVARNLGVGVFGQFTILAAIVYLGNVFTTYGVDVLLIRETARDRQVSALTSVALWLQIYLSLLWCLIFLICSRLFFTAELTTTLFIYNLSLVPMAFHTVFSSLLRAFERMELFMGLNLFTSSILLMGSIVLVKSPADLRILGVWLLLVQVLTALAGALLCRKTIPSFTIRAKPVFGEVAGLLRSGWRLALFAPLSLLSQRLNLFMLSSLTGELATGLFSASVRLAEGLKIGHFAVTNSLMPSLSRTSTPQQQRLNRYSLYGLLGISIVLGLIVTAAAEIIVEFIYGSDYRPSVDLLRIVVWVLVPYTFSVVFSLKLLMRGAESLVLKANISGLLAAFGFYLLLIPLFGARGAAWGTLAVETIQAAILITASRRPASPVNHAERIRSSR